MQGARRELTAGQSALLVMAAGALGLALQIRNGMYHPSALALVGVALVCTLAVVLDGRIVPDGLLTERGVVVLLLALLAGELALLLVQPVALGLSPQPGGDARFVLCVAGAGAAALAIAVGPPWLRRCGIGAMVALHFAAGVWILRRAEPMIDVYNFQRGSLEALRHGVDPYGIKFRNIYPNDSFYGPGLVVRGILQFGYPYPPLPLLLTAPALWLAGDIRYAHLAALTLSGLCIACARPGRVAPLAAGLVLFSPRFGLLVQMAWTEPFSMLFLTGTVWSALRAPRLVPLALGLLLASKQYLLFAAPAAWLLVPEPQRLRRLAVLLAQAIGVALVVTLPLALWNLRAFIRSAITLQFKQPFRDDALSVLVPLARAGVPRALGIALPLTLAPASAVLAIRRCPHSPAGFALAIAFIYLVFFALNKQAFCNYYFFPLGALCAAVAAAAPADERAPAQP